MAIRPTPIEYAPCTHCGSVRCWGGCPEAQYAAGREAGQAHVGRWQEPRTDADYRAGYRQGMREAGHRPIHWIGHARQRRARGEGIHLVAIRRAA